jgi:hypothetical protein
MGLGHLKSCLDQNPASPLRLRRGQEDRGVPNQQLLPPRVLLLDELPSISHAIRVRALHAQVVVLRVALEMFLERTLTLRLLSLLHYVEHFRGATYFSTGARK